MYFALTGHPPFTDGTLVQRLLAHQTKVPPSVRYERPDIDDSLLEILDKMMAKKAADRYQTASEVSEALARWLIEHASAAWKQKHMMLVAALCGMDALHAGRVNEQAALVLKGKEASVLAAESMADDRSINDDSQSGSSSKIERPRQRRPRERQPGSSVRLSSSTTDTAISRQIDPVQHVASRLSGPAAAMTTSNSAPQPVVPAPAPAARSNDITLQLRLTERMRLVLIAIGMLATIIICGFGMWYIMSQKNPVEEGKPSIPSKANVPANAPAAPAGNTPAGSIQAGARSV